MAWRAHGSDHNDLIQQLKKNDVLKSARVEQAMRKVDRKYFTTKDHYKDSPQSIGYSTSISAPHMHVHTLQHFEDQLKEGMCGLDIGSGSGYLSACMAYMVGINGKVYGIDHIPELIEQSVSNIKKGNKELLSSGMLEMHVGDGRVGYPPGAPYDAIHVGACATTLPKQLPEQLKPGGRLIIPVGPEDGNQELIQFDKYEDESIKKTVLMGVRYGTLGDKSRQIKGR